MTVNGSEISLSEFINLAENALVIEYPLDDDIESMLLYLNEEWVLVLNENKAPNQ